MKKILILLTSIAVVIFAIYFINNKTEVVDTTLTVNNPTPKDTYYKGIKNLHNMNIIKLTSSEEKHKQYYINNIFPKDLYQSYLNLDGEQYVKENIGNILHDDGEIVAFAFPTKFGFLLDMYDLKDWRPIENKILIYRNSFYNNYIVTICSNTDVGEIKFDVICYYKIGDKKFTKIPASLLSKGESYLTGGNVSNPGNDISFDEASRKVKSGVYNELNGKKLREVEYILP